MNRWRVHCNNGRVEIVEAEKAYADRHDGQLRFYNKTVGPTGTIATFSAGGWTFYIRLQEGQ